MTDNVGVNNLASEQINWLIYATTLNVIGLFNRPMRSCPLSNNNLASE